MFGADSLHSLRLQCLKQMLIPLARFCLRAGLSLRSFVNLTKAVFVEVAAQEMERRGDKANISRLSLMTGVHRKDVSRIIKGKDRSAPPFIGILARVVGQWEQDTRFTTSSGRPRVLSYEGETSEFKRLVRCITTDVDPGAVLFELDRLGILKKTRNGLKLVKQETKFRQDPQRGYEHVARDAEVLLTAVDENIFGLNEIPNLHLRTEYDNVFRDDLPVIRKWFLEKGAEFHKEARNFLSRFDKDVNPLPQKEAGITVCLNTVSLTVDPTVSDSDRLEQVRTTVTKK